MHPHRGIETVTYMLAGAVHHRDSIGNSGTIEAGDVQWSFLTTATMSRSVLQSNLFDFCWLWANPCMNPLPGTDLLS